MESGAPFQLVANPFWIQRRRHGLFESEYVLWRRRNARWQPGLEPCLLVLDSGNADIDCEVRDWTLTVRD